MAYKNVLAAAAEHPIMELDEECGRSLSLDDDATTQQISCA